MASGHELTRTVGAPLLAVVADRELQRDGPRTAEIASALTPLRPVRVALSLQWVASGGRRSPGVHRAFALLIVSAEKVRSLSQLSSPLCRYPHRFIHADPATVRRTSQRSD